MITCIQELKASLTGITPDATPNNPEPHVDPSPLPPPPPPSIQPNPNQFAYLKEMMESDKWPVATNPSIICDPESEIDKVERGRGVVELMIEDKSLEGKKVLEYGCADGYSTAYAVNGSKKAAFGLGYDIKPSETWDKLRSQNIFYTDKWEEVIQNGPYDAILAFDVIDHLEGETGGDALKKMSSVLSPSGRIYMRTHPWTSRHAIHNYHECNKAYIHLVFTEDELKQLFPNPKFFEHNNGVKWPLATYEQYVRDAGLEFVSEPRKIRDAIEPFFKIPVIAGRIMANTGMNPFPEFQMSLQWIDYILKKSESLPPAY